MKTKTNKSSLKIGVVVDQLLPGGVQMAAIEQVKDLNRLGHRVCLLILMRKKYVNSYAYLLKNVPHQYLSDSYPRFFRQTIKFPVFSFLSTLHVLGPLFAPLVIRSKAYDVLISHGTTTCLSTQALWRSRQIPYIAVIHDPMIFILDKCYSHTWLRCLFFILKPLVRHLEKSFIKEAKTTILVSRVHWYYMEKNYRIKPVVLSHGFKALKKIPPRRGKIILSFGRWEMKKNPFFLLKLLAAIPRAKLIIAGTWTNPNELEQFKNIVRQKKMDRLVRIITDYSPKILDQLCRQSRLWLHAHFEAFSLSGLEAAGHGLPIIIPQTSGITEIFEDGKHGFFPAKITIPEYRKYVVKLLKNERLAWRMGKEAWFMVKNRFSWKTHCQKLVQIIRLSLTADPRPTITVLETGHSLGTSLAGGDKLMEPMASCLSKHFRYNIIVPQVGARHWQTAGFAKKTHILPANRFDGSGAPVPVFLTYCQRMRQTYRLLIKQPFPHFLYSSTNVLPDILPAYMAKRKIPAQWIARIHHLIPPPSKRQGKLIVNIVSYLMQLTALYCMKNRADMVVALNQTVYSQLQMMGFPKQRLTVLGAGIDFEKISRYKPSQMAGFDGVYLGRLHPSKGIFDLVPIWKKVVNSCPKATLVVIGTGSKSTINKMKAIIFKAGLSRHITMTGYLPADKVLDHLKSAKIFLFTDHEAGWGLAVAEAMACRLPVVGYDIGVLGDVFQQGYITSPLHDTNDMARQIIYLLKHEKNRLRLGRQALLQAEKLSWPSVAYRFDKLLKRVSSNHE